MPLATLEPARRVDLPAEASRLRTGVTPKGLVAVGYLTLWGGNLIAALWVVEGELGLAGDDTGLKISGRSLNKKVAQTHNKQQHDEGFG